MMTKKGTWVFKKIKLKSVEILLRLLVSSLAQFLLFSRGLELTYKPHKDIHELSTEILPFLCVCQAS